MRTAPRGRAFANAGNMLLQASVIAGFLLLWEVSARLEWVHPFLLPPLSGVLVRVAQDVMSGLAFVDMGLTLYRALTGFGIAAVIGVPVGILMARSAPVRWFFDPIVSAGFPMPKIAFLPIFVLWFGLFDTSKIIMVAFSCIFPIIAAAYAGTQGVDKWPIWSARALGASERQILREVILPMALPQIITGLQIALPVGLITTIVTEMLMSSKGLGGSMINAGRFADSVGVFAGIVEIALLGIAVIRLVEYIRRRLLVWHSENR
jgi:ABC-type nitrate/sulfonate/bicarbonate transport system permease component